MSLLAVEIECVSQIVVVDLFVERNALGWVGVDGDVELQAFGEWGEERRGGDAFAEWYFF